MATDLYRRTIEFDYGDQERSDLMRKVWSPTPYMVDAFTGHTGDIREREMIDWCHDVFGPQCFPIHGKPGTWQRGGATVNGWTWFGFSTDAQMKQFCERWPSPAEVAA